ncbi:MAG: 3-hydroxyacyl-CoA dehydrogenase, partial [Thaumarchaeota archaeon]
KRDSRLILLCPLIKEYYGRGWWGRISGRGFYKYLGEGAGRAEVPRELSEKVDPLAILAPSANIIARLVKLGAASLEEIDEATKLALGFPKGIMGCFREAGYHRVVEELERKMTYDPEYYKPDEHLEEIFKPEGVGERAGSERMKRVVLRRKPPIAWIILNRPEKLNALTSEMMEDLDEVLKDLEGDDEVRVVVIRGAGKNAFSVGADINLFKGLSREEAEKESKRWKEIIDDIESFPKPTIAAIKGYCLGCGLEIALACDFRLASSNSILGQPEIRLGLIPGAGGTQRLVKLIGLGRAKELLMLGKKISAEEAERIGLVNMVIPPEDFDERVEGFALTLAEGPPIAFNLLKQAINLAGSYRIEDGYRFESEAFGRLFETEDLREGIDAFLSKRRPRFKGR